MLNLVQLRSFLAILILCTSAHSQASDLPISLYTPGAFNSEITQANIHQTICVTGWTRTVRPPAYVTEELKSDQISLYGFDDTDPTHYEEEHLIPLSLGGAPQNVRNLWPQPLRQAQQKDALELALNAAVCAGEMSLEQAQKTIDQNWIEAYEKYASMRKYAHGQTDIQP